MAAAYPLLKPLLGWADIKPSDTNLVLAAIALVIGVGVAFLDDPIYQIVEGRMWWPSWLAVRRTRKWKRHVARLYSKAQDLEDPRRAEYWYELRQFPVDEK